MIILILILGIIIYYSYFKKLTSIISIYMLFPSQIDIDNYRVILYSRINIDNIDSILISRDQLLYNNIKEHTKRDKKIRLYINNRISKDIKLRLKIWLNHIRYRPGSREYYKLVKQYKFNS